MTICNLFNKKISFNSFFIIFAVLSVFFWPFHVSAQQSSELSPEFSSRIEILPESQFADQNEFLNTYSTGFRVYAKHLNEVVFENIAIFLDDQTKPIDIREFDNSEKEYYLSSNTASGDELANLLDEGDHQIHFAYLPVGENDYIVYQTFDISCDFTSPEGQLKFDTNASVLPYVKKGETIDFLFEPSASSQDISQVLFGIGNQDFEGSKNEDGNFEYKYTVVDGLNLTYPTIKCVVSDYFGNRFETDLETNLLIDGQPSGIEILSPLDGRSYSSGAIELIYRIDPEFAEGSLRIYLDGELFDAGVVDDIAEGSHILEIYCEDEAGNLSYRKSSFFIDATAPEIFSQTPFEESYFLGDLIVFSGKSEANADAVLKIEGNAVSLALASKANPQGLFEFSIASEKLGIGNFHLSLILKDSFGNSKIYSLGTFKIEENVASKSQENCVTLTQAKNDQGKQDVTAKIADKRVVTQKSEESLSETEHASGAGKIISATDDRSGNARSVGFIFFALLLIIAIAFFSAGYYGYALVSSGRDLVENDAKKNVTKITDDERGAGLTTEKYKSVPRADLPKDAGGVQSSKVQKDNDEDKGTQVRW